MILKKLVNLILMINDSFHTESRIYEVAFRVEPSMIKNDFLIQNTILSNIFNLMHTLKKKKNIKILMKQIIRFFWKTLPIKYVEKKIKILEFKILCSFSIIYKVIPHIESYEYSELILLLLTIIIIIDWKKNAKRWFFFL